MFVTRKQLTVGSRQNITTTFFNLRSLFVFFFTTLSSKPRNSNTNFIHTFRNPSHQILHNLIDQACRSMEHLKQIHAQITVHGLAAEALTLGKLVSFCAVADSGDLRYAHKVFDEFPEPNKFMYNSLIRGFSNSDEPERALGLYRRMVAHSRLSPNEFTFPFVLKACAATSSYWEAILVHCQSVKLGIGSQVSVQNGLINVYIVCGLVLYARRVFDEMSERTIISWNTMIGGYSKHGFREDSFSLFREMRKFSVTPDKFTLVSLLSVCSQSCDLDSGRNLHSHIEVTGVKIDQRVRNSLLDMYAKCGDLQSAETIFDQIYDKNVVSWTSMVSGYAKNGLIESAKEIFDKMPAKNVVSWNAMISCYLKEARFKEALDLFRQMRTSNAVPDEATLVSILSTCSQIGDLVTGKEIHEYISHGNITLSVPLSNSLVDMYAKCGALETASNLFLNTPRKNLVSWNIIIGGLALHGRGAEAMERFEEMRERGFGPDKFTFTALLSACAHSGLVRSGQRFFRDMNSVHEIPPDLEHYACAVDLLARGGRFREAIGLIREMPMRPDVVIWGALLGACRIHGRVEIGKQVLKQVLELGSQSSGLLVLLSNLFCEARRWEEAAKLRKLVKCGGVTKSRAISFIEIDGVVCEFMADDKRHQLSSTIYELLDQLTDHLRQNLDPWDCIH